METVRLVHRGSRIMSPLIPSIVGLAVLVLTACSTVAPSATQQIPSTQPSSEEGMPPLSSAPVNACTYQALAPTPTPDLTTPTAIPFSNTTPIPYPIESPSAEVVAYPDLPPPALTASIEAWRDAVARVSVERASGPPSITTTVQGGMCGDVRSAARRLAWERLARSLLSCVSSSHRNNSSGPNRSRGSISRTTR